VIRMQRMQRICSHIFFSQGCTCNNSQTRNLKFILSNADIPSVSVKVALDGNNNNNNNGNNKHKKNINYNNPKVRERIWHHFHTNGETKRSGCHTTEGQ
jgi:hypothetical protein